MSESRTVRALEKEVDKLNKRITELEEIINYAVDGIETLSVLDSWPEGQMKKDVMAIKETLENAGIHQKRIKQLEAALQGMVPFIEDDFPIGTGTNHGTCATDEYQQACDAVIKALNS